ncbi:MAG: hypothetical protein U0401_26525 [Anaerolineae bacterium]
MEDAFVAGSGASGTVSEGQLTLCIDSVQKLHFLLFLHHHPDMAGTCREFAERLHLGDSPVLEKIMSDLYWAGFIQQAEHRYKLQDQPDVKNYLNQLARIFEDPLARQRLLAQVGRHTPHFH